MKKIVACFVLLLMVSSVLAPVGVGYAKEEVELEVAAGELRIWTDWGINPCKYVYPEHGEAIALVQVFNLSSTDQIFDMGNGDRLAIPPIEIRNYYYPIYYLAGQTVRFTITKLDKDGSGIRLQQALTLKIEPKQKGGEK